MNQQMVTKLETHMEELMNEGAEIYKSNSFIRDVATFMEHPVSKQVYDKYMSKRNEIEQVLLFMHLYDHISKKFGKQYDLNGLQKIALLSRAMKDPEIRHDVCMEMTRWLEKKYVHSTLFTIQEESSNDFLDDNHS